MSRVSGWFGIQIARSHQRDRKDCERQFKAAWEKFCSDPARFVEFMEMKRKRHVTSG